MKKFYKVEAFRPGEENALKYTFHVYSDNEQSAKNMVYRYTKYNGYRVRIANVKEIEILKLLGMASAKAKEEEVREIIDYVGQVLYVSGCWRVSNDT